ncbi:MAG: histidine phosphatase family protein [Lysobacterales bacterium]
MSIDPPSEPQQPGGLLHTLVVFRHAPAQYTRSGTDHERPLTSEGEQVALDRGRELTAQIPCIDHTLVSTATRTRQTAALALRDGPDPHFIEEIYDATAGELIAVLQRHGADSTVLVGHNPGVSELASLLSGTRQVLRPGDWVVVSFDPPVSQPLQWHSGKISASSINP